jgi:hypothetical protein
MTSAHTAIEATSETPHMSDFDIPPPVVLPRAVLFVMALLCGLLLALAVHISLSAAGGGLAGPWRELFPAHAAQLKAALAWWAVALSGCVGSFFAILLLRADPAQGPGARLLRLCLGIAFFVLLAAAGHSVSATPAAGIIPTAVTNLAAMSLGGFMAFCTTRFALSVATTTQARHIVSGMPIK